MDFYNFEEFCNKIKATILEYLPEVTGGQIYIHQVTKNNGIQLSALQILGEGQSCSPSIYLESYYEDYQDGASMEEILGDMAEFYRQHENELELNVENVDSFEIMKDKIIMRLVNYEMNQETLKQCPYIPWQDLAITFRWMAHQDDVGVATALVTNREMQEWKVAISELWEYAQKNMPIYFPAVYEDMEQILKEYLTDEERTLFVQEEEQRSQNIRMFILTNSQRMNGATSILYPDMVKQLSDKHPKGFYLLPSSIHEMLLIPWSEEIKIGDLKKMLRQANVGVVAGGELLSHHIYYYDTDKDSMKMF